MQTTLELADTRSTDGKASEEAHDDDDALIGRSLDGRYRILRRLGRGGMGSVYEAEHAALQTRVAVKVLQSTLSTNDKFRKRFLREARAASGIDSDHVVKITDFGATGDGLLYFVMELLEGQDFERFLDGRRVAWEEVEEIFGQALAALRAAHERGVVHRDVKPSNIFLCEAIPRGPRVKVVDFGIAKIGPSEEPGDGAVATIEALTATNEMFGTVAYMAPELVEGVAADARSDIYAVGVMMFRALTGQLPFRGPNAYKVLQKHVSEPVPSLRALAPEVSPAVESVVFRALAKHPEHRYQRVAELQAALDAAREGIIEPHAAALVGYTESMTRALATARYGQSGVFERSGTTSVVGGDDSGALLSARIRRPRLSLVAAAGLILVAAGVSAGVMRLVMETSGGGTRRGVESAGPGSQRGALEAAAESFTVARAEAEAEGEGSGATAAQQEAEQSGAAVAQQGAEQSGTAVAQQEAEQSGAAVVQQGGDRGRAGSVPEQDERSGTAVAPELAPPPVRVDTPRAAASDVSERAAPPQAAPVAASHAHQADAAPSAPAKVSPSSSPSRRRRPSKASEEAAPRKPVVRSMAEAAAQRCPEAVGQRFTVRGLLGQDGRFLQVTVTGGLTPTRACIESFVRSRSYGSGAMRAHELKLVVR